METPGFLERNYDEVILNLRRMVRMTLQVIPSGKFIDKWCFIEIWTLFIQNGFSCIPVMCVGRKDKKTCPCHWKNNIKCFIKIWRKGKVTWSCQSYSWWRTTNSVFPLGLFFKIQSLFPYLGIWKGQYSLRGKRFGYILWNSGETERAKKTFSKWLYGWDIIVWCTCLQLVVITSQCYSVISQYQMWTHVSVSL